ncbi:unnamed protein product [Angiostrongylus costaricensis]|uniref:Uncharacterized protein n=1 Tax=Angiostrongylus costaricensis TaxID=334426 RepID=A0A0R3PUP1_ANGCS|nr:unnamed protein product [Angiostrongylus costaricensis]
MCAWRLDLWERRPAALMASERRSGGGETRGHIAFRGAGLGEGTGCCALTQPSPPFPGKRAIAEGHVCRRRGTAEQHHILDPTILYWDPKQIVCTRSV